MRDGNADAQGADLWRIELDDARGSRPITENKINNQDYEKKPANTAAH
jgi:hypothetical protein